MNELSRAVGRRDRRARSRHSGLEERHRDGIAYPNSASGLALHVGVRTGRPAGAARERDAVATLHGTANGDEGAVHVEVERVGAVGVRDDDIVHRVRARASPAVVAGISRQNVAAHERDRPRFGGDERGVVREPEVVRVTRLRRGVTEGAARALHDRGGLPALEGQAITGSRWRRRWDRGCGRGLRGRRRGGRFGARVGLWRSAFGTPANCETVALSRYLAATYPD